VESFHFCVTRPTRSWSRSHLFSKKKYFVLGFPCSPESKIMGEWSDPTLVKLHARQRWNLSSQSVEIRNLSRTTITRQSCLFVHVNLGPDLLISFSWKSPMKVLNKSMRDWSQLLELFSVIFLIRLNYPPMTRGKAHWEQVVVSSSIKSLDLSCCAGP